MIVAKFLQWSQNATPSQRADGASALARAYLYAELSDAERRNAEVALTNCLDDHSPLVRRALAEAFASAADAPLHIVMALADDQSDISMIILGRSPLLRDADLIDCAAIGDAFAQSAIALRPRLSGPVAAALAEVGAREALISLAVNAGADLPEFSMRRMIERFGDDAEMREALLSRANLPAAVRSDIVGATAAALSDFVTACAWMSAERVQRVTREAREKATVIIAATAEDEPNGAQKLVAHLRASGQLTTGLVLRSLLCGNLGLFEAALCELSGLPARRVSGWVRDFRSSGFTALYRRANLPQAMLPAFRAALEAMRELGHMVDGADANLSRQMIERVLTACEQINDGDLDKLLSVLRRLEAEAARDEARLLSPELLRNATPAPVVREAATVAVSDEPPLRLVASNSASALHVLPVDRLGAYGLAAIEAELNAPYAMPEPIVDAHLALAHFEALTASKVERFDPSTVHVRVGANGKFMPMDEIELDLNDFRESLKVA